MTRRDTGLLKRRLSGGGLSVESLSGSLAGWRQRCLGIRPRIIAALYLSCVSICQCVHIDSLRHSQAVHHAALCGEAVNLSSLLNLLLTWSSLHTVAPHLACAWERQYAHHAGSTGFSTLASVVMIRRVDRAAPSFDYPSDVAQP